MKLANNRVLAFSVAAVAGIAMGASTQASAWFTRDHASKCTTIGGDLIDLNFALQNASESEAMTVICPADDTEAHPKHETNQLHVHGFDASNEEDVTTLVCRSDWEVSGGACAIGPDSEGYGEYALDLPTSAVWNVANEHDFGYFVITLPEQGEDVGNYSTLRGTYQAAL
jgi:hypothetical protein